MGIPTNAARKRERERDNIEATGSDTKFLELLTVFGEDCFYGYHTVDRIIPNLDGYF